MHAMYSQTQNNTYTQMSLDTSKQKLKTRLSLQSTLNIIRRGAAVPLSVILAPRWQDWGLLTYCYRTTLRSAWLDHSPSTK